MRNTIYGPIFSWLKDLQERVETIDPLRYEEEIKIFEIMSHFLFSIVKDGIRKKISDVISRTEKYEKIRQATEIKIKEIIRRNIIQIHKMDTENIPNVTMIVGRVHVAWMTLLMMIFHGMTPEASIAFWAHLLSLETGFIMLGLLQLKG
jgi:hypothetical protein